MKQSGGAESCHFIELLPGWDVSAHFVLLQCCAPRLDGSDIDERAVLVCPMTRGQWTCGPRQFSSWRRRPACNPGCRLAAEFVRPRTLMETNTLYLAGGLPIERPSSILDALM